LWRIDTINMYIKCPLEEVKNFVNKLIAFKDNFKWFFTLETKTFWP
jgi:hypothetical protein